MRIFTWAATTCIGHSLSVLKFYAIPHYCDWRKVQKIRLLLNTWQDPRTYINSSDSDSDRKVQNIYGEKVRNKNRYRCIFRSRDSRYNDIYRVRVRAQWHVNANESRNRIPSRGKGMSMQMRAEIAYQAEGKAYTPIAGGLALRAPRTLQPQEQSPKKPTWKVFFLRIFSLLPFLFSLKKMHLKPWSPKKKKKKKSTPGAICFD